MSQRIINIGTGPNTKDGDTVRQAFNLTNQNFTEIYGLLGQTQDSVLTTSIKGSVWADDSTLVIDGINGKIYATDVTTNRINLSNGIFTTTNSVSVAANTPTVIWTSYNTTITSSKLVIQVEGSVSPDANGSATWHTQICEAHVAKRANFTTAPAISIYGITYTSVSALATFTAQYNLGTGKMEVVATATNAGYPLNIKVFATEIGTSD